MSGCEGCLSAATKSTADMMARGIKNDIIKHIGGHCFGSQGKHSGTGLS